MRNRFSQLAMAAFLVLVSIGPSLSMAPPAFSNQLETIAYEGFDYTNGSSLNAANGGTGWSGAWGTATNPFQVVTPGLSYTGLTSAGGTSSWLSPGNPNSQNERCLQTPQNSGIVYLQFLSNFSANHGGGTPNIRLSSGGNQTGAIGNNNIPGNANMSILDSSLASVATSSTPIAQLNFTIVRINHNTNVTQMWVNPNLSSFNYFSPPTPDATATGFSPDIECILPITRNSGFFDEIKIMRVLEIVDDPAQVPPPVHQAVGFVGLESCAAVNRPDLNWAGVAGGGWSPSWAEWPNSGLGGDVCQRTLVYAGSGAWRVR